MPSQPPQGWEGRREGGRKENIFEHHGVRMFDVFVDMVLSLRHGADFENGFDTDPPAR
jgi:hypothetical protein